ncbi:RING-type domain-containing protein [Plasmodiophora brassicae]|uniref:RING-type domain-containing protein n=1 Tax=Plasmodiophora brassicae TaxID=37360 RepID=A0A0G4IQ78_PLABS|nr:hypothetical protein PBRA_000712 [Plasmodiophora brassicae]
MSNAISNFIAADCAFRNSSSDASREALGNASAELRSAYLPLVDLNNRHIVTSTLKKVGVLLTGQREELEHMSFLSGSVTIDGGRRCRRARTTEANTVDFLAEYSKCDTKRTKASSTGVPAHGIKVLLVGRQRYCDIILDAEDNYCSRITAVVVIIPGHSVIVVDTGSRSGISTMQRATDKPLEHSTRSLRKILYFSWEEAAILEISPYTRLMIWAESCLGCWDRPRGDLRFRPCGHSAFCRTCMEHHHYSSVTQRGDHLCPLCRQPVVHVEYGLYDVATHAQLDTGNG